MLHITAFVIATCTRDSPKLSRFTFLLRRFKLNILKCEALLHETIISMGSSVQLSTFMKWNIGNVISFKIENREGRDVTEKL